MGGGWGGGGGSASRQRRGKKNPPYVTLGGPAKPAGWATWAGPGRRAKGPHRPYTYEDQHPTEGVPPRWNPPPEIPIQLSRAYPEISLDTRPVCRHRIINLREQYRIPVKIPNTYDIMFMIVPGLSHKVIQVTVRESQVLHIHECTCDIPYLHPYRS